jgi:hypothetical protein
MEGANSGLHDGAADCCDDLHKLSAYRGAHDFLDGGNQLLIDHGP